ncbi:MAG TPA: hypothetical protein VGE32_14290 [Cellvibrio sp.]
MNKVIFTFSILVSAGLGYFAGKISNSSAVLAQPTEVSVQKNLIETPDSVGLPQNSNENNFHDIARASINQQNSLSPKLVVDQSAQDQIDAVKTEYEFKQRSEAFTNWLTKNQEAKPWFDLGVEMRGRFDAEETDYSWANEEEGHIQSLFAQEQALAGIAIKSTQCKSTQCQITISVMNQDHANETAMTISKVLGGEKFSQIIIDSQVQQGETILYVARNEKGFEFN